MQLLEREVSKCRRGTAAGVALKARACSEERGNHGDRHCGSHKENEEKESDLHGCHNLHYLDPL